MAADVFWSDNGRVFMREKEGGSNPLLIPYIIYVRVHYIIAIPLEIRHKSVARKGYRDCSVANVR